MKELGSEIAGGGKDSQQTQPKTNNPIVRTGRPVLSEQQSGSSVQEIENGSNLTAEAPMKEKGDLFSSCMPVPVNVQIKSKTQILLERRDPLKCTIHRFVRTARGNRHRLQIVWIATCSCEISLKLSRSRTREEDRESPSSRSTSSRLATK